MATARVRLSGRKSSSTGGKSELEAEFLRVWRLHPLAGRYGEPRTQFRFHPVRQWKMDFAWCAHMVYLEINGGQWTGGRHSGGSGAEGDAEKQNAAVLDGWLPILFWTSQLNRDPIGCVETVIAAIERKNRERAAMVRK